MIYQNCAHLFHTDNDKNISHINSVCQCTSVIMKEKDLKKPEFRDNS